MRIELIIACDRFNGISKIKNGSYVIPWVIKEDKQFFKKVTSDSQNFKKAVIMGKNTFLELSNPLPNRLNIIISESLNKEKQFKDLNIFQSCEEGYAFAKKEGIDILYIIGGMPIYLEFINKYKVQRIYFTYINDDYSCDVKVKFDLSKYDITNSDILKRDSFGLPYVTVYEYNLKTENPEERGYLQLIEKILINGTLKENRTENKSWSIFGDHLIFSLRNSVFPLLTTKKMFMRGLAEELLWFLRGETDSKILESKGVNIWKGNTTREFLDKRGLNDYPEGDIGPGYGFQWRHYSAEYTDCHNDYTGKGTDQILNVINLLKNNPESRRIILNSWNPAMLNSMALPPCHILFQLYIDHENSELHGIMYQRSVDVGLGLPFNIASYALLLIIFAKISGLSPGTLRMNFGDTHIYDNHVESLKEQLNREPYKFPKLRFEISDEDLHDYSFKKLKYENFILEEYQSYNSIKMEMVV